jgi:hypothetical protein
MTVVTTAAGIMVAVTAPQLQGHTTVVAITAVVIITAVMTGVITMVADIAVVVTTVAATEAGDSKTVLSLNGK